jgi:hypothetical protein
LLKIGTNHHQTNKQTTSNILINRSVAKATKVKY